MFAAADFGDPRLRNRAVQIVETPAAAKGLLPHSTLALREAALWIGRLGGQIGRKADGMPGVRTLRRGWRDLELLVHYASLSS